MASTKAEISRLADRLNTLDIPCRIQVFNEMVGWVRDACPKYAIIDFYQRVFFNPYSQEVARSVKWDNVLGRAVLTVAPSDSDS